MRVVITPPARGDIREVALRITERSAMQAHRFVDRIERRMQKIGDLPNAGAPRPQWGEGVRIVVFGKHLIIHRIRTEAVQVLRVLHGARDIDALLAEEPLPE